MGTRSLLVFGLLVAFAAPVVAHTKAVSPPASALAGHWSGTTAVRGQPTLTATADLSASGTKPIPGTLSISDDPPFQCTLKGQMKRHARVAMRIDCGDRGVFKMHGALGPDAGTLTGTWKGVRH